eukprot:PITA_36073
MLMEKSRSILSGVGLGQEFLAEVVETAYYQNNRSPSSVLEDKTPHEIWTRLPKEPKKIEFELKEEETNSKKEHEIEDEEPQNPTVIGSVQERRYSERYSPSSFCSNFSLSITDDDPRIIREVVDSKDRKLWKEAMVDEMAYLDKNEAWYLVELLAIRKSIGRKWVFKKKLNGEGTVEKYEARLVAKGYS